MVKARTTRGPIDGTWKEKNLDYEIETTRDPSPHQSQGALLEKKRTSITRLKLSTNTIGGIC